MKAYIAQNERISVHLKSQAKRAPGTRLPDALCSLYFLDPQSGMSGIIRQQPDGPVHTPRILVAQSTVSTSKPLGVLKSHSGFRLSALM